MAPYESESRPVASDDALPPVEPPSGAFIVQLFVVPGVIVGLIAAGMLLVSWVASAGENPATYIDALSKPGPMRWQTASTLASVLRDRNYIEFRRSGAMAQRLAAVLEAELDASAGEASKKVDDRNQAVMLRVFLAKALGEFRVADALPALLRAARTERYEGEREVRYAALEAIAVLAENIAEEKPGTRLEHPDLLPTLSELARSDDNALRARAAFTLGVLGGPDAEAELARLAGDPQPDVCFNASFGLARYGRASAVPGLKQALELDQSDAASGEKRKELQDYKRATIWLNALRAVEKLGQSNPALSLDEFPELIERLSTAEVPQQVQMAARDTLATLRKRTAAAPAK